MRTVYILLSIIAIYLLSCLGSCSLFRKNTKTTASARFDLKKQTEAQTLNSKTTQKETQIHSYWKDSIFYQFEVIREQIDQSKARTVETQENQQAKQEQTTKESKPIEPWIYAGIIFGLIAFILIFKKLIPNL